MNTSTAAAPTEAPRPAHRVGDFVYDALHAFVLWLCDSVLVLTGFLLAVAVRGVFARQHLAYSPDAPLMYLLCAVCFLASMVYEQVYGKGIETNDQTDLLVKAMTDGVIAAILLSFAVHHSGAISRAVVLLWYGANLALFALVRPHVVRHVGRSAHAKRIFLVGEPVTCHSAIYTALARLGYRVETQALGVPQLGQVLPENVVLLSPTGSVSSELIAHWEAKAPQIAVVPASPLAPFGARSVNLRGVQLFVLGHPLNRATNRAIKRAMDLAIGALLLLAFLPLGAVIACAIKLDSPGPIFYRQRRLGRNGKAFRVMKFRSMRSDADLVLQDLLTRDQSIQREFGQSFKLKRDPRVTRVGKLLRKLSLDELPQIWNVLVGDMSLVGPRPIVEAEVPKYGDVYPIVTSVRPGITGVWQTSGRSDVSYESRLRFDIGYIREWSVWRDVAVLLRTIATVLSPGAY